MAEVDVSQHTNTKETTKKRRNKTSMYSVDLFRLFSTALKLPRHDDKKKSQDPRRIKMSTGFDRQMDRLSWTGLHVGHRTYIHRLSLRAIFATSS